MVEISPSEKLSTAFAKAAELGIGPRLIPSRRVLLIDIKSLMQ